MGFIGPYTLGNICIDYTMINSFNINFIIIFFGGEVNDAHDLSVNGVSISFSSLFDSLRLLQQGQEGC